MTINSEVRAAGPFEGNDVATSFPFEFKVFADSEVLVVRELDGVELVLDLGTDYTVALSADQDSAPGGSVDLPVPLPVGYTLSMTSALAPLQPVDLTNQGGFYPRVINASLDRLTILVQQLSERLGRTLVAPISDGGSGFGDLPGKDARKGAVLAFHETTGAPLVGPSIASVRTVSTNVASINTVATNIDAVNTVAANVADVTNFADVYYGPNTANPSTRRDGSPLQKGDLYFNTSEDAMRTYDGTRWVAVASGSIGSTDFSGDGVTVDFVLASSPGAKNNTQVYINGVYQQKSEYALTGVGGTTITFNSPPPAGTNNIEVITFAPLPVDPLTADDIADLIELRGTAVRKDSDTGAAIIPGGTEAQRPASPVNGQLRYNSEKSQFEGYQGGEWEPIGGGDSSPVFSVMWWPQRSAVPAGYVVADGQALNRATYPDAWAGIQAGNVPTVAEATWQSTNTERGKFTAGNGSTTFRVPDYNGKFAGSLGAVFLRGDGALSAGVAGEIQLDAMQRITGRIRSQGTSTQWAPEGAFKGLPSGTLPSGLGLYEIGGQTGAVGFDSANSPGARTATETRPLNVTGCWVIKLFGAVVNVGSADAAQLASDYASLVSRVTALENTITFPKEFETGWLSFALGAELVIANLLGKKAYGWNAELQCQVAQAGYDPGEEVPCLVGADSYTNAGFQINLNTPDEIRVRVGSSYGPSVLNSDTGANVRPTPASWKVKFKFWRDV